MTTNRFRRFLAVALFAAGGFAACTVTPGVNPTLSAEEEAAARSADEREVVATLDAFHAAAAVADGERYFSLLADDAIYYGTDPTERWTKEDFRAFADPYFSTGRGWTYEMLDRYVFLDRSRRIAWFDETLRNENYGDVRGTGVLRRDEGGWRLVQYNLCFPVPNDLAGDLVEMIRAQQ